MKDLRLALRKLARRPGFTAVAVVSLALGIGANAAIFSVVNAVLLRPLPYAEPDRLVRIWETFAYPGGRGWGSVSVPNLRDWQEQNRSFTAIGAYTMGSFSLLHGDAPTQVPGTAVTPEVFAVLGVEPLLGRALRPGVDARGDRVAVLSHGLWQRLFGGDPAVVGSTARIDGVPHTVIGVMPPEFEFPPRFTTEWTPLDYSEALAENAAATGCRPSPAWRPG